MSRPGPPPISNAADERTMLGQFLDYYRGALLDRAYGLNDDQMQQRLLPSTLTIGNLLTHMAWVEQHWFRRRFDGEDLSEPWRSLDWQPGADPEMEIASGLDAADILNHFNFSVDDSRKRYERATSLDQLSEQGDEPWSLRWIVIHMIEEYARHCGHADLIRESIDGDTVDGW